MKPIAVYCAIISVLLLSCATLVDRQRVDKFEETERGYKHALLASDYALAARYLDPSIPKADPDHFNMLKIVDYKPTHVEVSEDLMRIEQEVLLKYFMLNTNILRTVTYQQVWRFNEPHKMWRLHTELPSFKP